MAAAPPSHRARGPAEALRRLAARGLGWVRSVPALHRPVHALAERLARHPAGARLIRSVLEPHALDPAAYARWIARCDALTEADLAAARNPAGRLAETGPLISVVIPVFDPDPAHLEAAIASVKAQVWPKWELCLADDASPGEATWARLEAAAASDPRIRIVRRAMNGHISAATNSALALAGGDFVAFMDQDDLIPPHALLEVAAELVRHPETDLIYTDEDKIDGRGRRVEPHFKTGWDPELMLAQNMASHLTVIRRSRVVETGGLREGLEGAQDWDLVLRVARAAGPERIRHIPAVLYHWRQAGQASFSETAMARCRAAAERAVNDHLAATGQAARARAATEGPAWLEITRDLPGPVPTVSVIVPTRDRADLLEACAEGVLSRTDWPDLELLVVDNDSVEPATQALFARLAADPKVRILPAPGPFNYSAINNAAVRESRGELLVFLNNDVEVRDSGWLKALAAQALRPEVGAAGAMLRCPDGRVQHAGVALGIGAASVAGALGVGAGPQDPGPSNRLRTARGVSAVTAACLAMRREVFAAAGGFDAEHLPVAFNDIDLCLKIRALGLQVIWTPQADLIHRESASRGSDLEARHAERFAREAAWMRTRWGGVLEADPFHGLNMDLSGGDWRPADPPRRRRPWALPPETWEAMLEASGREGTT
ncbi:MAG: glycosyltransferase family 2 protein [Phenylobacterium sp.]